MIDNNNTCLIVSIKKQNEVRCRVQTNMKRRILLQAKADCLQALPAAAVPQLELRVVASAGQGQAPDGCRSVIPDVARNK